MADGGMRTHDVPGKRCAMTCQRGAAIVTVLRNVLMWDEDCRLRACHCVIQRPRSNAGRKPCKIASDGSIATIG
ncbi:hypothetical protein XdyCFBP7245_05840 [Xanthomonas dyei]|uniref:Uncharacterized protein n=1 Tax=Xanthomonas dyei TaxID=743699 RepID=A0A2S7C7U5_9XANT|nr:hypothetical protein XdyCFBP7245_05840 [Xanthomonas dyei]